MANQRLWVMNQNDVDEMLQCHTDDLVMYLLFLSEATHLGDKRYYYQTAAYDIWEQ